MALSRAIGKYEYREIGSHKARGGGRAVNPQDIVANSVNGMAQHD